MSDGLDFRYYLFVARRRFLHFLAPMMAALVLGTAVIMSLPRIYNSSAKILVQSQQIPDVIAKSTVPTFATERIQQIQQRALTRANLLNIADKFKLFGEKKNVSKSDLVDLMRSRITFEMLELGNGNTRPKANERVAIAFAVGFDHESPTAANNVANELVTIVLEEDIRNRKNSAGETTKFVERELDNLKRDLAELDEKISNYKIANSNLLPEKLLFNMQSIEKVQIEISEIDRAEIDGRNQKRLLEIEANVKRVGANGPGQLNNGGVQSLEQKLAGLESDYSEKRVVFSENHPTMRSLKKQISVMTDEVAKMKIEVADAKPLDVSDPSLSVELKLIAQKSEMIDEQVALNTKRKAALNENLNELREIVAKSPEVGAQVDTMTRSRTALQDHVDEFLSKLQAARMGERMEGEQEAERFDVIEPPVVPTEPVRPKRSQLLLMALAASIGIGGASAFGAEFMDSTIRRSRDITHKLNTRLIVSIPYIKTRSEVRRNRGKAGLYFLGMLAGLAVALLLIHLLYQPLDLLFFSIKAKFGL
jgi:polysaccharide biosynthesis transport protein